VSISTSNHVRVLQTICFSAFPDLLINRLVRKSCVNIAGNVVLRMNYAGTITKVVPTVKQVFQRIHTTSMADADDARFTYFKDKILPELEAGISSDAGGILAHTMIYVPSYFDYVRLRNLFDGKDLEFVTCSEYSEDSDVRRSRSRFFTGQSPVLLLTERFHFFRRL
jgi:U3 small nucleolar RNA-associated protein 25